jgi:hypothetical protein
MARLTSIDERYVGDEPTISGTSSRSDLIHAYNWYNYFFDVDAAKGFVISYLKSKKANKTVLARVAQIDPNKLMNIGWNCRILLNGGNLPDDIKESFGNRLQELINAVKPKKAIAEVSTKPVISVQERIANRAQELIADLEDQIDIFVIDGKNDFDPAAWFRSQSIKGPVSKKIADYYKPLYDEVFDAVEDRNENAVQYYKRWKKAKLKKYMEFIKSIISAAAVNVEATKLARKPRKKKVKPASQIVSKVSYKKEDTEYNIKSVEPKDIVGSQQVWLFNTKYRSLTVLYSMSATGLSVKGTTIIGFDDKSSETKVLRKPETYLPLILKESKNGLKKIMTDLKSKNKVAKGRLNNDVIILRTIK